MCHVQKLGLKLKGQGHILTSKEIFNRNALMFVSGQQFCHFKMDLKLLCINVLDIMTMCHGQESGPKLKGQGHTCRSKFMICIWK
jgi:hypothetical protein